MKIVLRFVFSAVGLLVASYLVPGIKVGPFVELLGVAVILGLLNATMGTFLKVIAFLPMACTMGCFSLVINALVFWIAGKVALAIGLGFRVNGAWACFFGALVTSVITVFLERILRDLDDPPRFRRRSRPLKQVN